LSGLPGVQVAPVAPSVARHVTVGAKKLIVNSNFFHQGKYLICFLHDRRNPYHVKSHPVGKLYKNQIQKSKLGKTNILITFWRYMKVIRVKSMSKKQEQLCVQILL